MGSILVSSFIVLSSIFNPLSICTKLSCSDIKLTLKKGKLVLNKGNIIFASFS